MASKKYFLSEVELSIIREHYDGSTLAINKIMRLMNSKYPRWYIRRIAAENGWAKAKKTAWDPCEEEWLSEKFPIKGFVAIQNGLKKINGGILRSRPAIVLKAKRLHISKHSDGFTMRMMEDLLGVDHRKIKRWVHLGYLKGSRKGTDRTEAQGGDMWHFKASSIRDFIITYPEEIDIRRVESFNFINLVANLME